VGTDTARFLSSDRSDLEATFYRLLAEASPHAAERIKNTHRASPLRSFTGKPGFLRQPWGPGWALVGDAGYFKDPLSTHGMTAALRDSELLARAIGSTLTGELTEGEALNNYWLTRDLHSANLLEISDRVASYQWDLNELRPLLMSMSKAMNGDLEVLEGFTRAQTASAA
jgi:flavin-dependent dehydrogenase